MADKIAIPNKVKMGPRALLGLIKMGIKQGSIETVLEIIDEAMEQLPPDTPQENEL